MSTDDQLRAEIARLQAAINQHKAQTQSVGPPVARYSHSSNAYSRYPPPRPAHQTQWKPQSPNRPVRPFSKHMAWINPTASASSKNSRSPSIDSSGSGESSTSPSLPVTAVSNLSTNSTSGYIKRGNKLVRVCSETDASLPNVASLRPLSITKPKRPLPSRHLKLINPQATVQGDANSSYSSLTKPQWVQRRTRHMQLINAKVASQLTPRPLSSRRRRAREIAIGKAVFVLDRTGKKLKRKLSALDLAKHSLASPTTLRDAKAFTKTGRRALVRTAILGGNTVVRKRKSSTGKYCTFYNRFGRCSAGNQCPFIHDPNRVALCTRFLRGMCSAGDSCPFSHDRRPERVPLCYHFQRGQCHKPQCPYIHVRMSPEAPICRSFMYEGFCPKGKDCEYRHVYECPEFAETGECQRPKCRWPHIHRRKTARGPDAPLSAPSHSTSLADKSEPSTLESKRPPPPRSQRYMEMASLEPEENSTGDASLSQTDAAAKQESKATTIADDYDFIAFDD